MRRNGLWIIPLLLLYAHGSMAEVRVPEDSDKTSRRAENQLSNMLVGSWRLVSWIVHHPDGRIEHFMGENPTGLLIYDRSGNMSVQIMDSFRPNFEAGYSGTNLAELKEIFNGYLAYFGNYTINETEKTVVHHVKGITNPTFYGADLVRYFDLTGDQLVLSVGKDRKNNLVWMRFKE